MTVLFDVVVDIVARSGVWLAVVTAASAAIALTLRLAVARATGRRTRRPAAMVAWATVGAIAIASLAHRFEWPEAWDPSVWNRALHPLWAAAGAVAGTTASILWPTRPASTPEG